MINSPILITVYDRYDHFVRCINSLKLCYGADKTILYVALDYPKKDTSKKNYNNILAFVKKIDGFHDVRLIEREVNFGAAKNVYNAINSIFDDFDTLIISEDDNFFSKNFLIYMNKGLKLFQNDESIFSINGYNYPIESSILCKEDTYYKWTGFSAWGAGFWKNKYQKVDISTNYVDRFLKNYNNIKLLYKYADHYFPGAVTTLYEKSLAGDTIFSMYQSENSMLSVFPAISKVRNYGHDGSGVHNLSLSDELFSNQKIDNQKNFDFKHDITSIDLNLLLKTFFKRSFKSKFYYSLKLLIKHIINFFKISN